MHDLIRENKWVIVLGAILFFLFLGTWHAAHWNETEFLKFCMTQFNDFKVALLTIITGGVMENRAMNGRKTDGNGNGNGDKPKEGV